MKLNKRRKVTCDTCGHLDHVSRKNKVQPHTNINTGKLCVGSGTVSIAWAKLVCKWLK